MAPKPPLPDAGAAYIRQPAYPGGGEVRGTPQPEGRDEPRAECSGAFVVLGDCGNMAESNVIQAAKRPLNGKSGARAVRREARVPGVIYGGDTTGQQSISLDQNELSKLIARGRFLATVFELDVDGTRTKVIPRDVQLDPVRDTPLHVDFHRIGNDNQVRLRVPMKFVNELLSPGLKRGGVLNVVRRDVEVWAPADKLPESFEVNLEGLEIGRSIHISAVALPEGVRTVIQGRDFTIATIAGASSKGETDEATPGGAAAAGGDGAAPAAAAAGDAKAAAGKAAPAKAAPATAAKPDAKGKK